MGKHATVELFGCDGSYFCLSGRYAGDQGVVLGTNPQGLYDAPVKVDYKRGAFEIGGKPNKITYPYREITIGLGAMGDTPQQWGEVDSAIRMALDYEVDPWDPDAKPARLAITTQMSGTRSLNVLMSASPIMEMDTDPWDYEHSLLPVTLTAGQPMWTEDLWLGDDEHPSHWYLPSGSAGSGSVWMRNPTDRPMAHQWVCTGNGTPVLPDVSWTGAKGHRVPGIDFRSGRDDSGRTLATPPIDATNGSGCRVNVDRMLVPIVDFTNTNLVGEWAGNRLLYVVPPYTDWTELPVSVSGVTGGGFLIQLRQPRFWSRPWGLEKF
jgi:hypothetical protein